MNCMTKKMFLAGSLSASLLVTAFPANASDQANNSASIAVSNVNQSANSAAVASADSKEKKICMAIPALSGSRMPSRKCKTKAEWEMLGYEIADKNSANLRH